MSRKIYKAADGPEEWEKLYFRSRKGKGRTFRAAFAIFAREHDWRWPDPSWPLMPTSLFDEMQLVADVPPERLVPREVV